MARNLILIGSSNGSSNLGDLAMWKAAARVTRGRHPDVTIHTDGHAHWNPAMPDVNVHPFLYPEFIHLPGRSALPLRVARKVLNTADAAAMWRRTERFVSGNAWSDVSSEWLSLLSDRPIVVFTGAGGINDEFALHGVASWSAIARRALLNDGDVALIGQGIGPLVDDRVRAEARRFLNSASLLTTRDAESAETVRSLGVRPEPVPTPDWALLLPQDERTAQEAHRVVQRYSPSASYLVFSFHHWRASSVEHRTKLAEPLEMLIRLAAAQGHHVLGVANAVSSGIGDDRIFMSSLIKSLPADLAAHVTVVDEVMEPSVAKTVLGGAELLISTRYHPVVFALGERTPVIPLHFDDYYRQKMEGAIAWYGGLFSSFAIGTDPRILRSAAEQLSGQDMRSQIAAMNRQLIKNIEGPFIDWLDARL